ncbi:hypothetical protein DRQ36_07295 [bacterium]|nr:MAG: hypothetical protein DRQ36_07295 [bacterium]
MFFDEQAFWNGPTSGIYTDITEADNLTFDINIFLWLAFASTTTTCPIDPGSIILNVDGIDYTIANPELTWIEPNLDFTPSIPWSHGDTIVFELISVTDICGCSTSVPPCSFIVDIEPPVPDPVIPADGSVLFGVPDSIGVYISDWPAGVDPASFAYISVTVNGIPATGLTPVWDGGYLSIDGLSLVAGDSVVICLDSLFDAPTYDYCAPNDTSFCWWFMIMPCDLTVDASPDTAVCGFGVIGLSVETSGGSGFYTYSWTPPDGLDDPTLPNPTATAESTIIYTVEVYDDSLACSASDAVTILVSDPVANAGPDGVICPYSSIPLGCVPAATGGFGPYDYEWTDIYGTILYTEEHPFHSFSFDDETFILHVTDSLGCETWDTVSFIIDWEAIDSVHLITPEADEVLPAGSVYFEWDVFPSMPSVLYDFILDGILVFDHIDSNHVTLDFPCGETHNWTIVAWRLCEDIYLACGDSTPTFFEDSVPAFGDPPFHTEDCTEPYAVEVHVPDGDWTACDTDSIVAFIIDSVDIVESTIVMTVNTVSYHTTDPQLTWDGDSTLVFRPTTMWADGEIISVCVDSAENTDGIPLVMPVCWEFYIDRSPPEIVSITPTPGTEIPASTDSIEICIRDTLSGLDSVYVTINGVPYTFWSLGCVDTIVCLSTPIGPLFPGDTVDVDVWRMTDCPDWCGPNTDDSSWYNFVSSCYLTVIGHPDTGLCGPDSVDFWAEVSGGSGAYSCHWWPETPFDDPLSCTPTGWVDATGFVRVVVTDDSAFCFAEDTVWFALSELTVDAGPDGHICPDAIIELGCVPPASSGFEPYIYSWQYLDGTEFSNLPNPTYTFADTSVTLIVEVTDTLGCVAYDTVTYSIDYEPITAINLITPTGVPVPPGDIFFEWEPIPGTVDATYDFFIDGLPIFTGIDSTHVTLPFPCGETHGWGVVGYTICEEIYCACSGDTIFSSAYDTVLSANPAFHTTPCGVPSAMYIHVPDGDWTACNPDSIVWIISDSVGVVESTIEVEVEGVTYTTSAPELTWDGILSRLVFIPSPMWPSGTTVNACLTAVMNLDSVWLPDSVCGEFYVDLDPPVVWGIDPPPGSTILAPDFDHLDLFLFDYLSGLDESTVDITVNGISYGLTHPSVVWDGDSSYHACLCTLGIGLHFECDETVEVCITAGDSPDWCGPNMLDTCWEVYTAPCGLNAVIIEPLPNSISACDDQEIVMEMNLTDTLCPVDPTTIVLNVDGTDYIVTDPELDWSNPLLTWTPPVDWTHGTVVDVCLTEAEDSCGGTEPDLPICWTFYIDLEPPAPTIWDPSCSSAVNPVAGVDFHIELTDGPAYIDTVWVSFDGTPYEVNYTVTEDDTVAEFTWNPVSDGGITLIPGSAFEFCVHTGDSGIAYCAPHETLYCCDYFVTSDTGIVTAEIVTPFPGAVSACDDQRIVMSIQGSDASCTPDSGRNVLWIYNPVPVGWNVCDIYDTTFTGFNTFREITEALGYTHTQVAETEIITSSLLEGYNILVLGPMVSRRYTIDERDVVVDFVRSGHSVLALTIGGNAGISNIIMSAFGLEYLDTLSAYEPGCPTNFVLHPTTAGLTEICAEGANCVRISPPAMGIIFDYLDNVALGIAEYGCGKAAMYFDEQFIWNGPTSGIYTDITEADNEQFALNLFQWLSTTADDSTDCPIIPSSIVLRVDGTDYTVSDPELDWSPDLLTFTPISPLWTHDQTVDVCLTQAEDSCGASLPDSICWQFFIDLEPPDIVEFEPPCGDPILPGTVWWVDLEDRPAGIMLDTIVVIFEGVEYLMPEPDSIHRYHYGFNWDPADYGISLIPGTFVEFCIAAMDNPDYCAPNETLYCCEYPVVDTGGPIAYIRRVPDDTISACKPESIIVEIVSAYEVVESTIILGVNGVNYVTIDPQLYWLDPYLVYNPQPDWNDHDTIYAELIRADDIFGNPYTSYPYPLAWTFYIDRVPPTSQMTEPATEFTRNITPQIMIEVDDELAGVNPDSLVLTIEGVDYYYPDDFDWQPSSDGLSGYIIWRAVAVGIEFNAGDTVYIELRAVDKPDFCGPNIHTAEYQFIVEPWTPCLVNPNPFTPDGDNINEITAFDWPNMTTEGATIYIYTIRNVLVRKYDLAPQRRYEDFPARSWDGKDENGDRVPAGLYLYVVESGGRIVCNGTVTLVR